MAVSSHMPLREGGSKNFPAAVGRRRRLCEEFWSLGELNGFVKGKCRMNPVSSS